MSSRLLSLLLLALLAFATLAAGGCGVDTGEQGVAASPTPEGDDDDDDDGTGANPTPTPGGNPGAPTPTPNPTPAGPGNEVEINDDHDTATPIAPVTFSGSCGDADFSDIFTFPVTAGQTVTATLTYSDDPAEDLDLYVSNYDYTIDQGNEGLPPGDSPAQAAASFTAAEDAFVEVFCLYTENPATTYTGTITVQ